MNVSIQNLLNAVTAALDCGAKLGDTLRHAAPALKGKTRDEAATLLEPVLATIAGRYRTAVTGFKFHDQGDPKATQSPAAKAARMYAKRNIIDPLRMLGVDLGARTVDRSNKRDPVELLLARFAALTPAEQRRFKKSVTM